MILIREFLSNLCFCDKLTIARLNSTILIGSLITKLKLVSRLFFSFCFVIFLKGLKTSNVYIPETTLNKDKRAKVSKIKLFASSIISIINKVLGYLRLKPFYIGSTSQRL